MNEFDAITIEDALARLMRQLSGLHILLNKRLRWASRFTSDLDLNTSRFNKSRIWVSEFVSTVDGRNGTSHLTPRRFEQIRVGALAKMVSEISALAFSSPTRARITIAAELVFLEIQVSRALAELQRAHHLYRVKEGGPAEVLEDGYRLGSWEFGHKWSSEQFPGERWDFKGMDLELLIAGRSRRLLQARGPMLSQARVLKRLAQAERVADSGEPPKYCRQLPLASFSDDICASSILRKDTVPVDNFPFGKPGVDCTLNRSTRFVRDSDEGSEWFSGLTRLAKEILLSRCREGRTLEDTGALAEVRRTRERVRQVENVALKKLIWREEPIVEQQLADLVQGMTEHGYLRMELSEKGWVSKSGVLFGIPLLGVQSRLLGEMGKSILMFSETVGILLGARQEDELKKGIAEAEKAKVLWSLGEHWGSLKKSLPHWLSQFLICSHLDYSKFMEAWLSKKKAPNSEILPIIVRGKSDPVPIADVMAIFGLNYRNAIALASNAKGVVYDRTTKSVLQGDRKPKTVVETALEILERFPKGISQFDMFKEVRRERTASDAAIGPIAFHNLVGVFPNEYWGLIKNGAEPVFFPHSGIAPKGYACREDGVLLATIEVTGELLRGSGVPCNHWLTWKLGLRRFPAALSLSDQGGGEVRLTRSANNSSFGTMRERVGKFGLQEGDKFVLRIKPGEQQVEWLNLRLEPLEEMA